MKSQMGFRLASKSVTLNYYEWREREPSMR